MMILIAEDNVGLRYFLWRVLRDDGHRLIAASDGEEALRASRAHPGPIDLVLADFEMPRMNGLKLCRIIAAERPETKVVIMSGDPKARERCPVAGLPFLQKPFQLSGIRETIQTVFGHVAS